MADGPRWEDEQIPPITKNGVRLWQTISAIAFTAALGAVGWNVAQLQSISSSISGLAERTAFINEMRATDSTLQQTVSEIRARQMMNEHRLDVLESLSRSNGNGKP